jgi:hypothetical protein
MEIIFTSVVSEYQFDKINLANDILTLVYNYEKSNDRKLGQITINLKKYVH